MSTNFPASTFDPILITKEQLATLTPEQRIRSRLEAWWLSFRPMSWTLDQHLADPTYRMEGDPGSFECQLAIELADFIRKERNLGIDTTRLL